MQQRDVANYTDDNTYNKGKWLIIRTSRQHIQQRDVANYTDDKTTHTTKDDNTYNKDVANYTDDKTTHTTKGCG